MTPKEKAKELIEKYQFVEIANYTSMFEVKQCALIAKDDEIVSLRWLSLLCPFDNYMKDILNSKIEELKEVKQELKKI